MNRIPCSFLRTLVHTFRSTLHGPAQRRMSMPGSVFVLAGIALLLSSANSRAGAASEIYDDTFDNGITPEWRFLDTSTSGSPWNITTDNTSPLSGPVMTNDKATTQAVTQFDPQTLGINDHIAINIDLHTPTVQKTGAFTFSVLNTPELADGNYFGYTPGSTTDPLATAEGYTFAQNYGATTGTVQSITNNGKTVINTWPTSSGPVIGGSYAVYVGITLTRLSSTSIQVVVGINGFTVATITDNSPSTFNFNALRIDGMGVPINIDDVSVSSTPPAVVYHFTLPHAYVTSAGIYNSSNVMVRELWKKRSLPAGTYRKCWNELDPSTGQPVTAGNYMLKILYHNMDYIWDGVIGNTSNTFMSTLAAPNNPNAVYPYNYTYPYQSYNALSYMAITPNGDIFTSVGYNEAENSIYTSSTSNTQEALAASPSDQSAPFTFVAADRNNYYFTDEGGHYDVNNNTFVMARAIQPQVAGVAGGMGPIATFTNGIDVLTSGDADPANPVAQNYTSCIDVAHWPNNITTMISTPGFAIRAATLTVSSTAGLAVGDGITGTGIAWYGNTITAINGSTITISNAATATEGSENLTVTTTPQTFNEALVQMNDATGLAVETGAEITGAGNLMAVSHGGLGTVEIIDKSSTGPTSGSVLQTITVSPPGVITNGVFAPNTAAPGQVAFDPVGDLWIITGKSAICYTGPAGAGSNYSLSTNTISNLSEPLAIAVNPLNKDIVAIADGGTSQQVKFFNSSGIPLNYTLGQLGGYQGSSTPYNQPSPDVTTNKFFFELEDFGKYYDHACLAFDQNGGLWVGDPANYRALHFQGPTYATYVEQIATVPANYNVSADPNNPTRVYNGHLEYSVNYNVPLTPGDPTNPNDPISHGNGSWQLVRNWFGGTYPYATDGVINNILSFSNSSGWSYGIANGSGKKIVCLPPPGTPTSPTATAQLATSTPTLPNNNCIDNDGTIRYATNGPPSVSSNPPGYNYIQFINEEYLNTATASSGNPTWGSPTGLTTIPVTSAQQYPLFASTLYDPAADNGWGMGCRIPKTASNYYITYQAAGATYIDSNKNLIETTPNTHLGATTKGAGVFCWQNSPGATNDVPDGVGTFEDATDYAGEGFGNHDGIAVLNSGSQIVAAYDGQYGYYSNQWMHYSEDGLFIGQFGVTVGDYRAKPARLDTTTLGRLPAPGLAGNIGQGSMVNYEGTNYIYCSDEAYHAGIHRWRMDGTVKEMAGTMSVSSPPVSSSISFTASNWPSANYISNPGFEGEAATYSTTFGLGYAPNPVGWQVDNGPDGSGAGAFYTEWTDVGGYKATTNFARSLPYHATIAKTTTSGYYVAPFQVITGLTPGQAYTLSAYVHSSGGQSIARMFCNPTSNSPFYTSSPGYTYKAITQNTGLTLLTLPAVNASSTGTLEIGFEVQGTSAAGQYLDIDDVTLQ